MTDSSDDLAELIDFTKARAEGRGQKANGSSSNATSSTAIQPSAVSPTAIDFVTIDVEQSGFTHEGNGIAYYPLSSIPKALLLSADDATALGLKLIEMAAEWRLKHSHDEDTND